MTLRIRRAATLFNPADGELASLGAHFDRHHWIRLPGLIDGPLLQAVQSGIAAASFREVRHKHVRPPSVDVCMEPNVVSGMLELLCNDPVVLRALEALTGCAPLSRYNGFVYRLLPAAGHHHNWHDDLISERRLAMSVNIDAAPYEGGTLQIRDRESGRILEEVTNAGAGDAVVFRLDAALQHRVTPVTQGVKTAFAGWFRSSPTLRAALFEGRV